MSSFATGRGPSFTHFYGVASQWITPVRSRWFQPQTAHYNTLSFSSFVLVCCLFLSFVPFFPADHESAARIVASSSNEVAFRPPDLFAVLTGGLRNPDHASRWNTNPPGSPSRFSPPYFAEGGRALRLRHRQVCTRGLFLCTAWSPSSSRAFGP